MKPAGTRLLAFNSTPGRFTLASGNTAPPAFRFFAAAGSRF
jgi:hypothetical protein